ncbi:hypothetical protein AB840_14090 [Megasphaera cerevisiae DSM 20462]|uniref:CRISPR system Cms protein Csm5 n=1 Tax=Megasphaera cerevisiae DSM 20462 TaxID=1122219 RepID=A0A0J6WU87_9FIRM|nr:type III-A CRISPR-associated RAMP protein Csm5 [Megasphaera cerevisiae]KMO85337.1 hypothetical protein AB840_14090 [Megasphaera cerevisiae DSM 20462]SKA23284.1 CRISPR-associated protein Csm5 [Megasphaera cerevisiae DSM 20462]
MINSTKFEHKEYELTCIAPVHIGNGDVLKSYEYAYINNKGNRTVYFLDKMKWAKFLLESNLLDTYAAEAGRGKMILIDWLKRQRCVHNPEQLLKQLAISTAEAYPHTEVKRTLNDIARQAKSVQGVPYIPGSSIKGAIRTAILHHLIQKNPESYRSIWPEVKQAIQSHRGRKISSQQLEHIAFTKLPTTGRPDDALQSVMKGVSVSDAVRIDHKKNTVIIQKLDVSKKRGENNNSHYISLFRECIPAGTKLHFSITVDTEIMKYIGISSIEDLWKWSRDYIEEGLSMQKKVFDMNRDYIPEFKESELADVVLGGGTGFLSKTVYYALASDAEGRQVLAQFFDDIFTTKDRRTHMKQPAHHHQQDDDRLTPRTLKLAMTEGERWIMGLASVKEVR